ncbi:putative ankyrin repeat-containing protein [Dactylonectria estremocensis]|uniref:Ankyrin repeat-containing protein n=1 Tax=Dactylonectria estremocensis TaxID=1079267 RepID=A0A9P9D0L8_9HYPO|nr:putative ankyrin repeat-containing protein [Dactylonectria estremocensis]
MLRLPIELLLRIAAHLESERDVNAFARTNRWLFFCLDPFLYRRNVEQSDSSALQWAAACGRERTARRAIDAGSEGTGEALRLSATNGHEEVTRILLAVDGVDGNSRDDDGQTPLSHAAAEGHESVVRLLLDSGKNGHLDVAQLFVEAGADKEAKDDYGRTALHRAARNGHLDVARLLVETGADKEAKDGDGRTALHLTATTGHLDVARLLVDAGADKEANNGNSWTPLHQAAWDGDLDVARLLVEAGADNEAEDDYGLTPLYFAARNGHLDIARLLE